MKRVQCRLRVWVNPEATGAGYRRKVADEFRTRMPSNLPRRGRQHMVSVQNISWNTVGRTSSLL
jgi:hypothetical protein